MVDQTVRAQTVDISVDAGSLKVAERYVDAFGNLAKTNNSIIVPANLADISGLIAAAMQVVKSQAPARA